MLCRTSNETRTMVLLLLLLTGSIPSSALSLVPSNTSFSRPGFLYHNRRHFPISTCRGDVPDQLSSHSPLREGVLLHSTARSRSDPYDDDEDDFDDDDDEDERKYARVRRGGRRRRSRYLDDDDDDDDYEFDSEYDDEYEANYSRRRGFGERDDLYDEEEEEGDEEEEEDLLSGELIPNPILDSIDPDGASERFGDLFSDSKFWRDLAIFVTFVWVIEAITVPF